MMDTLVFRLKFRQLLLLHQISREPVLNRAARALNFSQPTASKLLQDIETDLGTRLFDRHAHGLSPTPAGQVAIRHAEQILADLGRLKHDIQAVENGLSGIVRIGAIGAALHHIVTPVFASLTDMHPEISATLHVGTSDHLMEMLQSGRLDLVIGRPMTMLPLEDLIIEDLALEPLLVVTGAQNPLPDQDALTLRDLAHARWVMQTLPSPMRRAVETAFTMARVPLPPHPIELSSVFATVDLLMQSTMVAAMPQSVFDHYRQCGMLRQLPVILPDLIGSYALIRMRDRMQTPAIAYMAEEIRRRAIEFPDNAIR